MVYDEDIRGRFITLRSITEEDADFSYRLRNDPRFVDIMGQPAESVEAQRQYIRRQRKEPGDYYFVVYNNAGERIGLIGAYKINGDTCETGRELNIGEPYETMEAEALLFEFCQTVLKLKKCTGIIYKSNQKQYRMMKRRGGYRITETVHHGIPAYYLESTFEEQNRRMDKVRELISKLSFSGEMQ